MSGPDIFAKPGERIRIFRQGVVIGDSRNLRGVLDFARRHSVRSWSADMTDDYGARVTLDFCSGATARFEFASWDVAQRWVRARRSWDLKGLRISPTYELWVSR